MDATAVYQSPPDCAANYLKSLKADTAVTLAALVINPPVTGQKSGQQAQCHRAADPGDRLAGFEVSVPMLVILVGRVEFSSGRF